MCKKTRNSSGDEIANVNFLYDDIVHVLQNTIDSCIPSQIDAVVMLHRVQVMAQFSLARGECLTLTLSLGVIPC